MTTLLSSSSYIILPWYNRSSWWLFLATGGFHERSQATIDRTRRAERALPPYDMCNRGHTYTHTHTHTHAHTSIAFCSGFNKHSIYINVLSRKLICIPYIHMSFVASDYLTARWHVHWSQGPSTGSVRRRCGPSTSVIVLTRTEAK